MCVHEAGTTANCRPREHGGARRYSSRPGVQQRARFILSIFPRLEASKCQLCHFSIHQRSEMPTMCRTGSHTTWKVASAKCLCHVRLVWCGIRSVLHSICSWHFKSWSVLRTWRTIILGVQWRRNETQRDKSKDLTSSLPLRLSDNNNRISLHAK